jgi:hypothetical protein
LNRLRHYAILALGLAMLAGLAGCGGGTPVASTSSAGASDVTLAPEQLADLESRIGAWSALSESVQATGVDKTSEIATFLWPVEQAQEQAAEYQQIWSEAADPSQPILGREFVRVVGVSASASGKDAVAMVESTLTGADGSSTKGLDLVTWTYQDGQWHRTTSFWVPTPTEGAKQALDKTVRTDALTWSPLSVEEVTTLGADGGAPKSGDVFLVLTMYISNGGETLGTPGDYSVALYSADGKQLQTAKVFDILFPGSAAARQVILDSGMDAQLTYCFAAPEDVDLATLQYEILPVR